MSKKVVGATLVVAAAIYVSCASIASGEPVRGPAGPEVPLDCSHEVETLPEPIRKRSGMEDGCLDSYVQRLDSALSASPEIQFHRIRSGRVEGIPPSSEWRIGLDPRHPDAPTLVIPVVFEESLRWQPYVITWFPRLEYTPPRSQGIVLQISKENLTSDGMELRLSALNGAEILDISIDWVAYDTMASAR